MWGVCVVSYNGAAAPLRGLGASVDESGTSNLVARERRAVGWEREMGRGEAMEEEEVRSTAAAGVRRQAIACMMGNVNVYDCRRKIARQEQSKSCGLVWIVFTPGAHCFFLGPFAIMIDTMTTCGLLGGASRMARPEFCRLC